MADASEMRDSPVGLPACGGAGSGTPDGKASVVQPFRAGSSADKTRAEALDYQENPVEDLIFDAGKLHSQLADLLQLYLQRASDPDAVQKCSAKDAISCAKTLTAMMSDVQSGKPASVDSSVGRGFTSPSGWLRAPPSGLSVGRGPLPATPKVPEGVPRHLHNAKPGNGGPRFGSAQRPELVEGRVAALQPESASIRTLEDAVSVVCMSDEETQILEPWARLIARIQKLCTETQKRLDAAQNDDPPVGQDFTSLGWLRAPPDDDDSVVQPRPGGQAFRAGSSADKTRAKALDYRERRQSSRAGESSGTCGVADKPGVLNEGSSTPADDGKLKTDGCFT